MLRDFFSDARFVITEKVGGVSLKRHLSTIHISHHQKVLTRSRVRARDTDDANGHGYGLRPW